MSVRRKTSSTLRTIALAGRRGGSSRGISSENQRRGATGGRSPPVCTPYVAAASVPPRELCAHLHAHGRPVPRPTRNSQKSDADRAHRRERRAARPMLRRTPVADVSGGDLLVFEGMLAGV